MSELTSAVDQMQQSSAAIYSSPIMNTSSSSDDRMYTGAFEGPEKTLEVCFRTSTGHTPQDVGGTPTGLRTLPRNSLNEICSLASCNILSSISNTYLDAYVLSESSLFVYPYMLILKTCGTTTLLRILKRLLEMAAEIGLVLDWVGYSRKNLMRPEEQLYPHTSWEQEMKYITDHKDFTDRLCGNGYTLGPVTGDHWFVWVADRTIRNEAVGTDRVINIMMFDIDPVVAEKFYADKYEDPNEEKKSPLSSSSFSSEGLTRIQRISREMTKSAGIENLVPGATIDPRAFEPCGYSMNAILYNSYATMHVTPERGSSYVSFESNQKLKGYGALISNVVRTFKPKRFVITLMADEAGLAQINDNPLSNTDRRPITVPVTGGIMSYRRSALASIQVEDDTCCLMGNFVLEEEEIRSQNDVKRAASYT
ncbi:hypothetical protein TrLO_g599 [Triparma laevis f. longispina]|uniref:adenosylmethionine decarboxylase n=1 Tax=Triparma laevis f. longispina TaxID=1714387 RepID=A0A9W7CE67_9STRA|nr:hypothetical protein TrLO_g599 [Triparma laevis f. longispina]